MRAAIVTDYGSPITVVEVERPMLTPDSVMIEVHASSVNPIDSLIARGVMKEMLPYQLPWVVGYDVSGVVVECGADVTKFHMADEVSRRAWRTSTVFTSPPSTCRRAARCWRRWPA